MYPNDLHFEIASLRGQDLRNEAAHERLLRQAARNEQSAPSDPIATPPIGGLPSRLSAGFWRRCWHSGLGVRGVLSCWAALLSYQPS
ncbi:MAG TPA: hypothetical protein VGJ60_25700 [Chloroflexota bacterium]